jgi:hypothetical protein
MVFAHRNPRRECMPWVSLWSSEPRRMREVSAPEDCTLKFTHPLASKRVLSDLRRGGAESRSARASLCESDCNRLEKTEPAVPAALPNQLCENGSD